ncbi:MAG: hypothetical protein ACREO4_03510 [Lysobacter sp.]
MKPGTVKAALGGSRVEGIVRGPRQFQYEIVPLPLIRDTSLSYRALGVLTRLLSNESSYRMTSSDLARERKEGRDAARAALREIETAGYLVRERRQNSRGQWVTDMVVYDSPQLTTPPQSADFQSSGGQSSGAQSSENQALRTALPVSKTTTTTTGGDDLQWDFLPQVCEEQRSVVVGLMEGLTATLQQELIDELAGALRAGVIKGAWPAWLYKLTERAREGLFQPSQALSIRADRQRRVEQKSGAGSISQVKPKKKVAVSSPETARAHFARIMEELGKGARTGG